VLLGVEWTRPLGFLALLLPIAVLLLSRLLERPVAIATGTLALWKRVLAARPSASPRSRMRIPPAVWLPLASARKWIDENLPRGAEVSWIDRREPFGPEVDLADTLWVTDRAPQPPPRRAGFVASGGSAAPGPIAVEGSTRFDWDGEKIVEVPDGAPKRRLALTAGIPRPIADVLAAWGEARGTILTTGDDPEASLAVRTQATGERRELEVGRDGWTARVVAAGHAASTTTWLEDAEHRALVAYAPGVVESAIVSMDEPTGDPAAFAVSWAKLFDEAVLAPPGVVDLGERRSAGEESFRAPETSPGEGTTSASFPWEAWATVAAGCAILLAAWAGGLRAPVAHFTQRH
jgi:hypothetical protein